MENLTDAQNLIIEECEELKKMLLEKNRNYGNSALEPKRIFSRANSEEQIRVRIDDKLSRIMNGSTDEDAEKDLLGYLILLRVAKKMEKKRISDLDLEAKQKLETYIKKMSER